MSQIASSPSAIICPVLAGPALVKGTVLRFRSFSCELQINAPASYLAKIYEWCNGERSLQAIEKLAIDRWGNTDFVNFVHALMDASVMVDAASYLRHCAGSADYPSWMGLPAPAATWREGILQPPVTQPTSECTRTLPRARQKVLAGITAKRISVTRFDDAIFQAQQLSDLLQMAYGFQQHSEKQGLHRTVPSAGGFYGLQLHVILLKAADTLAAGVYQTCFATDGSISLLHASSDLKDAPRAVVHPHLLSQAAGLIVISGNVSAAELKYRNRAYRYALLEAGCVLQNLGLASAELGVGWRVIGGYDDLRMRALGHIPSEQELLAAGVFGLPDASNGRTARSDLEFHWSADFPESGLHIGRARLTAHEDHPYSWGKDSDPVCAYDKAVGEAIERYAYSGAVARHDQYAAFRDLNEAVDPRDLVAYSPTQYRTPDFPFRPFNCQAQLPWVAGREIFSDQQALILADCVFDLGQDKVAALRGLYSHANSSGCASGISIERATDSAVLELIERDAFMRHWFAQEGGIEIERASLPSHVIQRLSYLEKSGCHTSVQHLTLGIYPVFLVMIQHQSLHFTAVGAGTGFTDAALDSALSEAEILALARLRGAASKPLTPANVRLASEHADLYAQRAYFRRANKLFPSGESTSYSMVNEQLARDSQQLWDRLEALNQRVIRIDLTLTNAPQTLARNDIVTVRAFMPGLVPLNFGYGRLPLGMDKYRHTQARFPHPFS